MIIDYFAVCLGFIAALVGIAGDTRAPRRNGRRRLTLVGWMALATAIASLGLGVLTISGKNSELVQLDRLRVVAYRQLQEGLKELLQHLVIGQFSGSSVDAAFFDAVKTKDYLGRLGRLQLVNIWGGQPIGYYYRGLRHPYEAYDYHIQHGVSVLNDALIKYGHVLDVETLLLVNEVLFDKFFVEDFRFDGSHRTFLDLAHGDLRDADWGLLGLYYFDASAEEAKRGEGEYGPFLEFVGKAEKLVAHLRHGIN